MFIVRFLNIGCVWLTFDSYVCLRRFGTEPMQGQEEITGRTIEQMKKKKERKKEMKELHGD